MVKAKQQVNTDVPNCSGYILPVRDTLDILSGKWKLPILGCLMGGAKRFKEIERDIPNISAKMLSKELKELEMNELVMRTVYDTMPVSIEYALAPYGRSLDKVIFAMKEWGDEHRKRILKKK